MFLCHCKVNAAIMDKMISLIGLLQITDSFFPSGAFAYSWGLETYVTEGRVKDMDGLK